MMSGMPRLAARFPPGGCLDDRLGGPRRIGRRGRGGVGGIAVQLGRNSWSSACKSAICLRASSKAARS